MVLRYMTIEEFEAWPLKDKIGYMGWDRDAVLIFREKYKDLIKTTYKDKEKARSLAESLFKGIIPAGLKKVLVGRLSSFDMWYSFELNGEEISFGLNTRIPFETIDKIEWI